MTNTVPQHLHEDASVDSFVKEQERKKAALDDLKKEEMARLASLNSPLPSMASDSFSKPLKPQPVAPPSKPASSPSLSLMEMTMRKPIRQQIPTQDLANEGEEEEDDVDFFEFSRNGNNKSMSLKDIMSSSGGSSSDDGKDDAKQKSKMWGIDLDKI